METIENNLANGNNTTLLDSLDTKYEETTRICRRLLLIDPNQREQAFTQQDDYFDDSHIENIKKETI